MPTDTPLAPQSRLDATGAAFREAVRRYEDEIDPFLRGTIATELYRDRPDLPVSRLRAEVLARTLESIDPVVIPEALIAGSAIRRMRVHGGISDSEGWRRFAIFPEATPPVELPTDSAAVRQTYEYWRQPDVTRPAIKNAIRERNPHLNRYAIARPHGTCGGHTLPDHGIILCAGIDALISRVRRRLVAPAVSVTEVPSSADPAAAAGTADGRSRGVPPTADGDGRTQLEAMLRCLEGLSHHAERQAWAVEAWSRSVDDRAIRSRLERTARVCRGVAHRAPRTFHEALQLLYFSNFADRAGNTGDASSFGRVDRLLIGFLRRDYAAGRLDREEAFELLCHFAIKIWGDQESRNLTIGGVDPETGEDATNELSWMFLEAMDVTGMTFDLSVRVHEATPDPFLSYAASIMKKRFGRPDVYNDDAAVPALLGAGFSVEDARDYAPLGCVEIMIPGRSTGRTMAMGLNHLKILELVLNGGRCLVTGDPVWDDVPESFTGFGELLACFEGKVAEVVAVGCEIIREDERLEPTVYPRPWLTVLSRGGIEDARDVTAGQPKYDPVGVTMDGLADTANSLYAVNRLVFEEERLSISELREVLAADWSGHEALRREVIHEFPRFGNDEEAVDALASRIAAHYADCFCEERTYYGGRFLPMIFGVTTGLLSGHGPGTGATASGRHKGTVIAQSLQPSATGPQGSPTEVLRSAASVDFGRFPGGISNVQSFDPSLFGGDAGDALVCDLIRGYFALGGMELAMNFVSAEELREAQRRPEEYPYLMVRLFGMSARFILLSEELQETVIAKIEAASARR